MLELLDRLVDDDELVVDELLDVLLEVVEDEEVVDELVVELLLVVLEEVVLDEVVLLEVVDEDDDVHEVDELLVVEVDDE